MLYMYVMLYIIRHKFLNFGGLPQLLSRAVE